MDGGLAMQGREFVKFSGALGRATGFGERIRNGVCEKKVPRMFRFLEEHVS